MHERSEGRGENQGAAGSQQPRKFIQFMGRLGHMLQDFTTENRIEAMGFHV